MHILINEVKKDHKIILLKNTIIREYYCGYVEVKNKSYHYSNPEEYNENFPNLFADIEISYANYLEGDKFFIGFHTLDSCDRNIPLEMVVIRLEKLLNKVLKFDKVYSHVF